MSFLGGRKGRYRQLPTLGPEAGGFLKQLFQGLSPEGGAGGGYEQALQQLMGIITGSPESFEAFEAPARRGFQEQTIPNILERFSGRGAGSSSGLQQTLGAAGERLEEGLAKQRGGMKQDAIRQLLQNFMQQAQLGLGTREFETAYEKGTPGFIEQFIQSMMTGMEKFGEMGGRAAGAAAFGGI